MAIKPNLIIPGFPKSGTSSLFDYLCQHPDVYKPTIKEPHTYAFDSRYNLRFSERGDYNFYKLYTDSYKFKYVPDASSVYMISDKALKRIKNDNAENLKIIIIARDPIERIFSHYNWLRMLGYEQATFKDEINLNNQHKFKAENHIKGNYKNYLEFSFYGAQLKRCIDTFDKRNILIIPMERLKKEFDQIFSEIFDFLDIKPIHVNKAVKNKTPIERKVKKKIPKSIRILESKIGKNIISRSSLFKKTVRPVEFSEEDEFFLFNLLKKDLEILYDMDLVFSEWETVNKYLK